METTLISILVGIIHLCILIIVILSAFRKDTDKIRYYGIYPESSENLIKIVWTYKKELTYSDIIKIKKDFRLFQNEEVTVRELTDNKVAEFTGYNITNK